MLSIIDIGSIIPNIKIETVQRELAMKKPKYEPRIENNAIERNIIFIAGVMNL